MSSSRTRATEILKRHMTGKGLTHTEEWLVACYDFLTQEYSTDELTEDFVLENVYLQWLDANLEDMESQCLPSNLRNERLKVLTGTFALQINSIQDIGESAYNQYNQLKKLENENTSVQATESTAIPVWEPKPRRTLYLTMTDGSQKVYGLEVEAISSLSLATKPGLKILIDGPVDCRRGVLHLKPKNVKPLGGEVEPYLTQNSVETILCQILNKPISTSSSPQSLQQTPSQPSLPATAQATPHANSAANSHNTNNLQSFNSRPTQVIPTVSQQTTQPIFDEFDDDDFFLGIDEKILLATPPIPKPQTAQNPTSSTAKPSNSKTSKKAVLKLPPLKRITPAPSSTAESTVPKMDSDSTKKLTTKPLLTVIRNQQPTSRTNSIKTNGFNSSDDELFLLGDNPITTPRSHRSSSPEVITLNDDDIACAPKTQRSMKPVSNRCRPVPAAPYQYIKQITTGQIKIGATIVIKGIITTLTSNIDVDKTTGEWKLHANINDGSGFLIARVAPQVLNRIVGFSPSEMKQMKATKSALEKEKIGKGMKSLVTRLVHFSGILRIKITKEENLILEMNNVTNDHVHDLLTRTALFAAS